MTSAESEGGGRESRGRRRRGIVRSQNRPALLNDGLYFLAHGLYQVWFLAFDRFQLLDVCGPLQVFATSNDELRLASRTALYETRVCGLDADLVRSSSGVVLPARPLPRRLTRPVDTLIILRRSGGVGARQGRRSRGRPG